MDRTTAILGGGIVAGLIMIGIARKAHPQVRRVLCYGDSLTADGGYAREIRRHLPEGSEVKKVGFVGKGTGYLRNHLKAELAWGPTDVVILGGVNDLASGRGSGVVIDDLQVMYDRIHDSGARVIAVHLTPWASHSKGQKQQGNTRFVNHWISYGSDANVVVNTDQLGNGLRELWDQYNAGDGLHLNQRGQKALGWMIYEKAFR